MYAIGACIIMSSYKQDYLRTLCTFNVCYNSLTHIRMPPSDLPMFMFPRNMHLHAIPYCTYYIIIATHPMYY